MTLLADLQQILPADRLSATQADRAQHSKDQSAHHAVLPDVVVWPESTAEVSAVLKYANARGVPVTAWGAGSSLEGNPIPVRGGIVLDFTRMNRILAIHAADFQVTVQPGLFYKDMNRELAKHGLFFPPDPGANASLGGMLANNAAGTRTVKYGATRDNVLALEVVLASGEVIRTGSRSVKQSSGYDLTHLFVGSEGTLGLITEATLKLYPLPEHFSAATAAFPTVKQAADVVYEVIGAGLEPSALELLDATAVEIINAASGFNLPVAPNLFLEFTGAGATALEERMAAVADICRSHGCLSFRAGIGRDERARLWEARHHAFEAHLRYFPGQDYIVTDFAVPISQYPALVAYASDTMAQLGFKGSIISHAGDGNAHVAVFYPPDDAALYERVQDFNARLVRRAIELGGTSTGEHGVGLGKQKFMELEHGPGALNVMRQIKRLLDPNNILNPGKVLALE
ncbi:MAG: FAD-linked oxidase C-terminal domain-containing protein [Anaerolineales bacterium]|nr:FAD-linked oxidase C-terminal domain-containing protein [Anaerolineales bacterium]